jgi:FMN phosphatase YigB (HAD superfamily)
VTLLLVDFGNTLAEENFIRHDSRRFPTWTDAWLDLGTELVGAWEAGRLSGLDIAGELARRLSASPRDVHAYMRDCCREIVFHPEIVRALKARHARHEPQIMVSVNPDLFDEVLNHYRLRAFFDAVVTSAEEGSCDKAELCHRALRIAGTRPSASLLIDNLQLNVNAWESAGGQGYLYTTDEQFASDVRARVVPGFQPLDVTATG